MIGVINFGCGIVVIVCIGGLLFLLHLVFLLRDRNLRLPSLQSLILVDIIIDFPLPATLLSVFHLLQVPLDFTLDEIALLFHEMLLLHQ
jgi:hypothetical protein